MAFLSQQPQLKEQLGTVAVITLSAAFAQAPGPAPSALLAMERSGQSAATAGG